MFGLNRPAVPRAVAAASAPIVTQTLRFATLEARGTRLAQLGARAVTAEPGTNLPRWKTAAGIVLRARHTDNDLDVLSNCVC